MFNPSDIISVISSWMAVPFDGIAQSLITFAQAVQSLTQEVAGIFPGFVTLIADAITHPLQLINAAIQGIGDVIINSFQTLFVPNSNVLNSTVSGYVDTMNSKIPIIQQVVQSGSHFVTDSLSTPKKPDFRINIPSWGINNQSILDVNLIDDYMPFVRSIIAAFYYIYGIQKIIKMIPSVISGLGALD